MEKSTSSKEDQGSNDRNTKIKEGSWLNQFRYGSNPWMARYVYGFMFMIVNLLAWAIRDYGSILMKEMKRVKDCNGGVDCLGTEGVLRISFGCFMFYFVMFLSTAGTSKLNGCREKWHSERWLSKMGMMLALIILPFLLPIEIISIYAEVAHFGAGVFLIIQLVSVISFITWLNDCCHSKKHGDRCHIHVMIFSTVAYIICLLGIILMYVWYTPEPSCLLNIFFISWTLALLQVMTSISLHPKVNAGFLTPGFMGLYIVFLCWSAIRSEPPEEKCIQKAQGASSKADVLTIISFIVAVLAIVVATFSTGIDSKCFQVQFWKDSEVEVEEEEEDHVPYGFGFFHFVFATGAMYFAMLLIGWNAHQVMKKFTIDIGWTSTWVRIVNEWLAACVYIWMLVAPVVWKAKQAGET
ncbi:unnamed protein product [Cuscuta epithymum]|uniref:Serine incorporator n=1 Tax=Cuscuta epithymum TaxID=186058 RepID=A0AAV0F7C3_9ASTE|nr:unnamed protein product [Cuscuta epithymum]